KIYIYPIYLVKTSVGKLKEEGQLDSYFAATSKV
ncbi:MAG: hypothetical protein ACJAT1_002223, partial [Marivirga sp.]